ncbi:lipopolysaccharide transport periplasmic protein LptA [Marinobacter sp. R17]|uniref:lipopolysaccharide transport periplasmic protein LptA n=1 Tax=Marinobacter TaxID=2742 RepID=UPI000F4AF826|nr:MULTISPECIES: lipopolysaccharide transport periplasmic protein LptA [Marinobacter]ROU01960.1 lipopolysaccharide transport periplasmic protein LptA [Marinobacter sp. R17]
MNCHLRNKSRLLRRIAGAALLVLASQAQAFDLNSDSPIKVSADQARLDDAKGTAIYTGDVVVRQDGTELTADKVVLYREQGALNRIEAHGKPAHYTQPKTADTAKTDAEAMTIIYAAGENRITFIEKAVIHQDGNVFKGEEINYDTATRVVTASGSRDGNDQDGRVEMVIQPRQKTGGESGN